MKRMLLVLGIVAASVALAAEPATSKTPVASSAEFLSAARLEKRRILVEQMREEARRNKESRDAYEESVRTEYCQEWEDESWAKAQFERNPPSDQEMRSQWAKDDPVGRYCVSLGFKP